MVANLKMKTMASTPRDKSQGMLQPESSSKVSISPLVASSHHTDDGFWALVRSISLTMTTHPCVRVSVSTICTIILL